MYQPTESTLNEQGWSHRNAGSVGKRTQGDRQCSFIGQTTNRRGQARQSKEQDKTKASEIRNLKAHMKARPQSNDENGIAGPPDVTCYCANGACNAVYKLPLLGVHPVDKANGLPMGSVWRGCPGICGGWFCSKVMCGGVLKKHLPICLARKIG